MAAKSSPRKLVTAYALWLFCPLYPLYAMYLGRDAHCWLYTVTLGGFGIGFVCDALAMPLYVADHNESAGYMERAEKRHNSWFAWSTLFGPARWAILMGVACVFAVIGANLLPPDNVLAPHVATLFEQATGERLRFPARPSAGKTYTNGHLWLIALRLLAGVVAASLACRVATPCVLTVRRSVRFRHMLSWGVIVVALSLGSDDIIEKTKAEGAASQICIGALGVWFGALRGRSYAPQRKPRETTKRMFSLRLVRQAVLVGCFWLAAGGAYYQNGSYTSTDKETGKTTYYTGAEAMHEGWKHCSTFYGELGKAVNNARLQYANTSWYDILQELREAFADPAVEAADVLGLSSTASASEVRKAHRELAREHHPDKVGDSPEAQTKMQRLNWAKEVLLARSS